MAQRIVEELYLEDGRRTIARHPSLQNALVVQAGRHYAFELYRKATTFGDVLVDQFWMPIASVYGRNGRQARNYKPLVAYYWARCFQEGSISDDEVVDSYILASLMPFCRHNGCRRIFDDAVLTRPKRVGERKHELIENLDRQLADTQGEELDMATFSTKTGELLGPPTFEDGVQDAYDELIDDVLGEGRQAVQRHGDPGLEVPRKALTTWMKSIGRRRGNEVKKIALDILSYECRTAVHRCYSAVWDKLLSHLETKYALDEASLQYHRLMHFDITLPSDRPDARFHLFHGHVFALHPGLSLFVQTPMGGVLIADYLRTQDGDRPFRRLLHGFWIGVWDYYLRSDQYAEARKKRPAYFGDLDRLA